MNILTFDIEDWFHILNNPATKYESQWTNFEYRIHSNMDKIFGLLADNNIKATFYCLGWIAEKHPDIIKRIDNLGYEIGSHSHLHKVLWSISKDDFANDLKTSVNTLQNITGKKVVTFRAPGFSLSESSKWAFEILIENGIEIDSSVAYTNLGYGQGKLYNFRTPCIVNVNGSIIKELPLNVVSLFGRNIIYSGGGWFRLFPYLVLKSLMSRDDYVMSYFHPRDFDDKQPVLPDIKPWRKFKSYYGLSQCMPKLDKIIKSFEFIDVAHATNLIDWNTVPVKHV